MKLLLSSTMAGLMLATTCVGASAQSKSEPTSASAQPDSFASPIRAVRDQATGKLRRATAEEAAALAAAERAERVAKGLPDPQVDAPVVVRVHPNGMTSAVLGTEHLVTVQARRGADGRLLRSHTHPSLEHPTAAAPRSNTRPLE